MREWPRRAALALLCVAFGGGLTGCSSLGRVLGRAEPKPPAAAASAPRPVVSYTLEIDAPSDLRALLSRHLDLARFQSADEADRLSAIELDRLVASTRVQALALLETEGYFNAEVEVARAGSDRVTIAVKPGPRAAVEKVELTFEGELKDDAELRQKLRGDWALDVGKRFSQPSWGGAKAALLARVRADGYPLAHWGSTAALVNAEKNSVELQLQLDSGPQFRLGEMKIEGLSRQSEQSVRRLANFAPGEPYSERRLLDFQERLQKTLLFDNVQVEIIPVAAEARQSTVWVRLREASLQQATLGVGYHANNGQRATLEHIHRQPFGLPLRSKSKLDLGREKRAAALELSSHPQPDMRRNLASLEIAEDRSGDSINTSLSGRIGRLHETERDEKLGYLELMRAREDRADQRVTSGALSINQQWIRRRLDSALLPTDGHQGLLLVGLGRADSSQAANGMFGRLHLKLGWYKPLPGGWYANARAELGQVLAADNVGIPEKLLFRAGGDESVRGYAYQSLGPQRDGQTVGGRVLAAGSVELARPVSANLPSVWGAVFVDAGQAATGWRDFRPALGYGVGVRWRSPVGPLRIDIARGHATERWRAHFSVGIEL